LLPSKSQHKLLRSNIARRRAATEQPSKVDKIRQDGWPAVSTNIFCAPDQSIFVKIPHEAHLLSTYIHAQIHHTYTHTHIHTCIHRRTHWSARMAAPSTGSSGLVHCAQCSFARDWHDRHGGKCKAALAPRRHLTVRPGAMCVSRDGQ
jgi:hypothetical protein